MLDRIQKGVMPLTQEDNFRLKTVAYGMYHSVYVIELLSKKITIFFQGFNVTRYPQISCVFSVHSEKMRFLAEFLFPATGINIAVSPTRAKFDLDKSYYLTDGRCRPPITEPDVLDFYEDLERWCQLIHTNWNKIESLFTEENIETTKTAYFQEVKKINPAYNGFFSECPVGISKTFSRSDPEKQIIDFSEILLAIRPLYGICQRETITIDVDTSRIDITAYAVAIPGWKLLWHTTESGRLDLYFILCSWLNFPVKRDDFQKSDRMLIFSYQNVFNTLGIPYVNRQKGLLEDLSEYSHLIRDNSDKILTAFSRENIEKTYSLLKDSTGNNEEEICGVLSNLNDLCD